jgi:hypothetical protein
MKRMWLQKKVNQEEAYLVNVCAYNINMLQVSFRDQTTQPYFLSEKKGIKPYF